MHHVPCKWKTDDFCDWEGLCWSVEKTLRGEIANGEMPGVLKG